MSPTRDDTCKVVHLTSAHTPDDTRISVKECATLAAAGFDVVIVGPGVPLRQTGSVRIRPVRPEYRRFRRMLLSPWAVYRAAVGERAAIYHIHDPELLFVAFLLRLRGRLVVYDVHEDLPLQILGKTWIPRRCRRAVAVGAALTERLAAAALDLLVVATPSIAERFPPRKTVLVRNLPLLDELVPPAGRPFAERPRAAAYVGAITELRGARQMVTAAAAFSADGCPGFVLAGDMASDALAASLRAQPGWSRVRYVGWQSRRELRRTLAEVRLGLLPLLPAPNYVTALPTKLFEYMSAGLPVVASDFPLWRDIVESAGCGLLVDPLDPDDIAGAVRTLLDDPQRAQEMGARGRAAVERDYNWSAEGERLVAAYRGLAARAAARRPCRGVTRSGGGPR